MPLDATAKPPAKQRAAKPPKLTAAERAQRATERTAELATAFSLVGHRFGGLEEKVTTPDKLAFEYWAASEISSLAEKRRDEAKKAAVTGGVIPDFKANPLDVGTRSTLYISELLTIAVDVTQQAPRLDGLALVADLVKAGVKPGLLKRLVKRHTKTFAGAHVITATLTG